LDASFTQSAFFAVFTIIPLAITCWIARYPNRTINGILIGVPTGFALLMITSIIVGLFGYAIPFGQIDFWLASLVSSILR